MNPERYNALVKDFSLSLTPQELDEGWTFCSCEWDGMLIHKDDVEATFCVCLQRRLDGFVT